MSEVAFTAEFKRNYKKVKKNHRWNLIFNGEVPFEDEKHRSPWDYVMDCFYNDRSIPKYFYEHNITLTQTKVKQIKKRLINKNITIQGLDLHFDGHNGDHLLLYARTPHTIYLINIGSHSDLF